MKQARPNVKEVMQLYHIVGSFIFVGGETMRIFRIFNNNIVATITDDQKEAIAQGSGIGFQKKAGDLIDESKIEKLFVFHDEERAKFDKLMEDTPIEYFQVAQEIAQRAKEVLRIELSNKILISLCDHISFAIEREKQGIVLPNLMLTEIRTLYKEQYKIGLWALKRIEIVLHMTLPIDEAAYIAIHIVNAMLNVSSENTTNILLLIKGVMDIIQRNYDIDLKDDSLDTLRLTTHLKFLAQRIFTKEATTFEESADMYELLICKNKHLRLCIDEITQYIKQEFAYELSQEEQVYLMIHLLKVIR